ncbi:MAG: hypothetical protein J6T14_05870 [Clostridia bacterium]|nr:hypothetical protein [Clostridia bacterium]
MKRFAAILMAATATAMTCLAGTNGWVLVEYGGTGYMTKVPESGSKTIIGGAVTVNADGSVVFNVPEPPVKTNMPPMEVTLPDGSVRSIPKPEPGTYRSLHHRGRMYCIDSDGNVITEEERRARDAKWEAEHPEEAAARKARRDAARIKHRERMEKIRKARRDAGEKVPELKPAPVRRDEVQDPGWAEPEPDTPEKTAAINAVKGKGRKFGRKSLDRQNRPGRGE